MKSLAVVTPFAASILSVAHAKAKWNNDLDNNQIDMAYDYNYEDFGIKIQSDYTMTDDGDMDDATEDFSVTFAGDTTLFSKFNG